jgi:hypothetical protein
MAKNQLWSTASFGQASLHHSHCKAGVDVNMDRSPSFRVKIQPLRSLFPSFGRGKRSKGPTTRCEYDGPASDLERMPGFRKRRGKFPTADRVSAAIGSSGFFEIHADRYARDSQPVFASTQVRYSQISPSDTALVQGCCWSNGRQ